MRPDAPLEVGESYLRPKNNGRGWSGASYLVGFSRDQRPKLEALLPSFRLMVLDGSAIGTDSTPTHNESADEGGDEVIIDIEEGHAVRAPGTFRVSFRVQAKVRGQLDPEDAAGAGSGAGAGAGKRVP